jgi:TDG/mug DNA glycosylase family protein
MPESLRIWKPTKHQVAAARDRHLPDLIAPELRVLFVGINPSLYSAAVGHHFARPGNRFWPALHAGGFTERLLSAFEGGQLLAKGYGITNVVNRATAKAEELSSAELIAGADVLEAKARRFKPAFIAFLGVSAYRTAFGRTNAAVGAQNELLVQSRIWLLPSPSGLNAHYQLADLGRLFDELRRGVVSARNGAER